ncbi:MAG: P1 family peptidase [Proteobacteria bacterium]|nr:P1 family peptidase [Pseudomonadota bacterium]
MSRPGKRNLITDVAGLRVGNAQDAAVRTGVTVILPGERAVVGVDVRGGAPATRETDLLDPTCLIDKVDAIVLTGGSSFGLDAAGGAVGWLAGRGRGFPVRDTVVPIVPAAALFDIVNGGDKNWGDNPPYRGLAAQACESAATDFALGNAGAGFGAVCMAGRLKSGLGSASTVMKDGVTVGAVVAANPFGMVTVPGQSAFWAWALEQDGEFGGLPPPTKPEPADLEYDVRGHLAGQTTLAVVATDAELSGAQARRIAIMGHDGIARAVRPVHTPFDGDTVFCLSTAKRPLGDDAALSQIGMAAADCISRAIARAVYEAESLGGLKGYRETHAIS